MPLKREWVLVALGVAIGLLINNLPIGIGVKLTMGAGTGYSGIFSRKKPASKEEYEEVHTLDLFQSQREPEGRAWTSHSPISNLPSNI